MLIRVLLADDHTLVRAGIRNLLQSFGDIDIVAETGDGRDALELIQAHQPDVAVLDIMMPGLNGLEVAARASKEWPHLRILILSVHAHEECVSQALRAGAAGFLVKDAAVSELEIAVRALARGDTYLSPAVSKLLIADFLHGGATHASLEHLTPRQRQILKLAAEGQSSKEIAHTLQISVKTVENHRTHMMDCLDIHDLASLTRYAIRVGLVNSDR
jgi:DNA-binding NarL/FixJ family response regulator